MKNFKNLKALLEKDYKNYGYGERNVAKAHRSATERKCDTLVFDSIIWEAEILETVETLKANNVKEFYFCVNYSSQVTIIATIIENGYKLVGSTNVPEYCSRFNEQTYETGLVFKLSSK